MTSNLLYKIFSGPKLYKTWRYLTHRKVLQNTESLTLEPDGPKNETTKVILSSQSWIIKHQSSQSSIIVIMKILNNNWSMRFNLLVLWLWLWFRSKQVVYFFEAETELLCPPNYALFPFNTHSCEIAVSSSWLHWWNGWLLVHFWLIIDYLLVKYINYWGILCPPNSCKVTILHLISLISW